MQDIATTDDAIRVYWMTGCSSCLRTKEFLQKHGVPFLSRNVLEDESAYAELERFGLKQVPIVTRGALWVNGQVLRDVARLCDITYGEVRMLPVEVMRARLDAVLAGAARFLAQMPDEALARMLPNRPRSFAELGWHIANIADAFLEHEDGIPLTFDSYMRVPMPKQSGRAQLIAYCEEMRRRMAEWFDGPGRRCDWSKRCTPDCGTIFMCRQQRISPGIGSACNPAATPTEMRPRSVNGVHAPFVATPAESLRGKIAIRTLPSTGALH